MNWEMSTVMGYSMLFWEKGMKLSLLCVLRITFRSVTKNVGL